MKKSLILCAGLCLAISFASCGGSKESAYKKATQATVIDNTDNASVRSEAVTVVDGTGLSNFSVVVGSFSSKANALALQQRLKGQGHPAQVAYNASINFYRVIVSTFADKGDAVRSRNQFRAQYPDAWLLLKK